MTPDRDFMFGATADPSRHIRYTGENTAERSDLLKALADEAQRPRYRREVIPPARRFGRWVWQVRVEVGGTGEIVVGPNTAWTKRAADRRSYRHESRLIREAAKR
jgi:hypothetical protein